MSSKTRCDEIIRFARNIRDNWGNDPFEIAKKCGFVVVECEDKTPTGSTILVPNYFTVITLNGCKTDASRYVICAHELGHALLHDDMAINRFNGTSDSQQDECEYEANLFAVALLIDEKDLNIPLREMENWMLKGILDYNI
ncbi:MAG: ImmA/IrrE family metallo-endopeptidase [Lachnospiraceae bacterium]|nr:ImmA/IrrE family metallo-endopeptidase [Lachnospiraceae bacterium]